jgi:hypothetical protein
MTIDQILIYLKDIKERDNNPNKIAEVNESLKRIKDKFVKENNQQEAKNMWIYEQILKIQDIYLKVYQQMKQEDFYNAWCFLEQCELTLGFLRPHFSISDDKYFLNFIDKHTKQYQSLFPYKIYMSPEILEIEKTCNICGKKVSIHKPCGHETGEIYNGEMCIRIVTKPELLGISCCKSPLQKYSVPFMTDKMTGKAVDHYNYVVVNYLIKRLKSPFDSWNVNWTKRRHPHSRFKNVRINDKCPCGSGKKYKNCCLKESGVLMPHCEFVFSVPPPVELQNIEYSY